jgi:hypothetical protein
MVRTVLARESVEEGALSGLTCEPGSEFSQRLSVRARPF